MNRKVKYRTKRNKQLIVKESTSSITTYQQDKKKFFYESERVKILNDNIITTDEIPENSIDLIITSPPYNVEIEYNIHNDKESYNDYLEFTQKWLQKCFYLTKNDGRFCLNIPLDKNKGGQQSVCADITTITKQIGWKYHSTIIWNEGNISRRTAWGSFMSASAPYVIAPVRRKNRVHFNKTS